MTLSNNNFHFKVRREGDPREGSEHILALNKNGVSFLDLITHETLLHYPFTEVISTRRVQTDDGTLFLDMKCGNLMQQRITRIQTEQANEIARLIKQYITIDQRMKGISVQAQVHSSVDYFVPFLRMEKLKVTSTLRLKLCFFQTLLHAQKKGNFFHCVMIKNRFLCYLSTTYCCCLDKKTTLLREMSNYFPALQSLRNNHKNQQWLEKS